MVTNAPRGTYETWVSRIRQWAKDPYTSLDDLPPLTHESFSPATFQRLLKHIDRAFERVMKDWDASLSNALKHATSEHDQARALVQSRTILYRRVQLSKHPGLPLKIRESLMKSTRVAIFDLQKQLETSIIKDNSATVSDIALRDRFLMIVKQNALTEVLNENYRDSNAIVAIVDDITTNRYGSAGKTE